MSKPKCAFPNESRSYRGARDKLLAAEIELRTQVERVARKRRALPMGGAVKEDYSFDELMSGKPRKVKLSELFLPGKDTLFLYNYMYGPKAELPCPMCTSLLDGLEGQVEHVTQRIAVAVVAKSPIERIVKFTAARHWSRLRLLSSAANSYNADYLGEDAEGNQWPMANVFVRHDGVIRHFWGSEMLYAKTKGNTRHVDLLWPLWNVLDLTPGGRGDDFYPKLSY